MPQIDWERSALLRERLHADEGTRAFPYDDKTGKTIKKLNTGGRITIGIGRNLSDKGLSVDEVDLLLRNDIKGVCIDLDNQIPHWKEFPQHIQYVLINMCFNLGIHGLLKFEKLLESFAQEDYVNAVREMTNSLWYKQTGNRAKRLVNIVTRNDMTW